ncbi:MAG: pseudouridine synthase [Thermodesulfobacteriota bacterium]
MERLQKILARAGVTSRRGAEKLILSGRVRLNGLLITTLGVKADPVEDMIEVDGLPLTAAEESVYFIFNKPSGFITSLRDPRHRPTIVQFIDHLKARVYPVGRLDRDAEGLLILTNDGELARRLMHPRFHVSKTYRVKVQGRPSEESLNLFCSGALILGHRPAKPAEAEVIKVGQDRTWLKLTLTEGRHHQIKRMCALIGHPVLKLKRIGFGPLKLGRLEPGGVRPLSVQEIKALKKSAGGEEDD